MSSIATRICSVWLTRSTVCLNWIRVPYVKHARETGISATQMKFVRVRG
jgi:hypothetical protein